VPDGGLRHQEQEAGVQEQLIDAMVHPKQALTPHIKQL
jgi:hypothetical protein